MRRAGLEAVGMDMVVASRLVEEVHVADQVMLLESEDKACRPRCTQSVLIARCSAVNVVRISRTRRRLDWHCQVIVQVARGARRDPFCLVSRVESPLSRNVLSHESCQHCGRSSDAARAWRRSREVSQADELRNRLRRIPGKERGGEGPIRGVFSPRRILPMVRLDSGSRATLFDAANGCSDELVSGQA